MSTVPWHLLEICSGTGDDDVRVYAIELDVDDTAIEPRRTSLVAERDRGWARAHLCLDYLLSVGSRDARMPLDGLGLALFQGHLHAASPGDTLDVQPVCVWVDERARRRYEPTTGTPGAGGAGLRGPPAHASTLESARLAGGTGASYPATGPAAACGRGSGAGRAGGAPPLRRLTPGYSAAHDGQPNSLRRLQRRPGRRRLDAAVAQSGADGAYALRCAPGGRARRA